VNEKNSDKEKGGGDSLLKKREHTDISLVTIFHYGNWCGENFGGFDNVCRSYCTKDLI
jgi:hypothetical protein